MKNKLKNIFLVGGSSNLGLSIINKINLDEYRIYSTFNKNKIINKLSSKIIQIKVDLSNNLKLEKLLHKITFDFDVILFLQGELNGKPLKKFNTKEIIRNLDINFTSQSIILKHLIKKQKKNCLVIFVSSISAVKGSYDPIYAASKGATLSLIKSLSKSEAPKLKFVGVLPGTIDNTKMFMTLPIKKRKLLLSQIPNKELLNSDDLANILIDLIKPHWRHANGSIININGGLY